MSITVQGVYLLLLQVDSFTFDPPEYNVVTEESPAGDGPTADIS